METDDNKSSHGETDDNQIVNGETDYNQAGSLGDTDDNQAGGGETDDNTDFEDEDEDDDWDDDDDDDEDWQDPEEIEKKNGEYLAMFGEDLRKSGLSERTIGSHLSNADLFLNEFLLYREELSMQAGVSMLGSFLGDFYIRKCAWSAPGNIKTTAASLKKFYKSMLGRGLIRDSDYRHLSDEIKDKMEDWQRDCAKYNDPDQDDPFYPF